ncbi:MAG: nickel pincer cofactor biosynthesis protein LarC [Candidatus Hermodarchaeota archaeon]
MKSLYIDASNSGISGDMFLASLLELIPNPKQIIDELIELKDYLKGIKKLEIELVKVKRSGIMVNQLKLNIEESKSQRSSNSLKIALQTFLSEKEYSESAKIYAINVLETLLQAEAEIHNNLVENIHLHELSSVDTLIDILGVAKALDKLGIFEKDFRIFCSKLPLGAGKIKTAHGILAIPAPATIKILEKSGLVVTNGPIESELVTPTGAALLVNLNPRYLIYPNEMTLEKVVYSTGEKDFKDFLNILRIFYGESTYLEIKTLYSPLQKYIEDITILETDVDDVSGELIGNFIKTLETKQVLDIQVIPSITKKNRPSHVIKILCHPENSFEIIETILKELGTLGVRFKTTKRVCIDREIINAKIQINENEYAVRYKVSYFQTEKGKKVVNIKPEYEDLKKISISAGLPIKEILIYAQSKLKKIYESYKK